MIHLVRYLATDHDEVLRWHLVGKNRPATSPPALEAQLKKVIVGDASNRGNVFRTYVDHRSLLCVSKFSLVSKLSVNFV